MASLEQEVNALGALHELQRRLNTVTPGTDQWYSLITAICKLYINSSIRILENKDG